MADEKNNPNEIKVDINPDNTPVLYTDSIFMTVNEDGVVLDVVQRLGNTSQGKVVSRIGMSKVHAKKFHKALGDLLENSEGRIQTGKRIEA